MRANFLLGSLKITNEARKVLKRLPYDPVARHAINWRYPAGPTSSA